MHDFLEEVYVTKKSGGDVYRVIDRYEKEYKYVYIYNDLCARCIFTAEENVPLIADFVNAALMLTGSDCVRSPHIENPVVSGGLLYREIEEDVLLTQARFDENGDEIPGDRIGVEFQHYGRKVYSSRMIFYMARHVGNMLKKGESYKKIQKLNLISIQFFDYLPWKISQEYRHTIRFKDESLNEFSDRVTLTIIEVNKFLRHGDAFAGDKSRLAEWLRAIDALNRNKDFSRFALDENFACLQKWARVGTFTPEVFFKAGEHMRDDVELAADDAREEGRMEGREEGRMEGREEGREEERRRYFSERAALESSNAALESNNAALESSNAALRAEIRRLRMLLAAQGR